MDMVRHHAESTSLLPESREGSNYDATTAAGGLGRGRHHYRRRARPKPLFPRLAGLVVGGIAVALTVAAAVFFHDTRGGSSSNSNRDTDLYPGNKQTTSSLSEKDSTIASHGEDSSTPPSSLGMSGAGDVRISSGGGGGGNGEKKSEAAEEEEEETPPNVIFILIDDMGMNDMGSSSTDMAEATPFIDSLAKDGVRLTRYYTNNICTPARASVMTGRDSFRTGMQFEELDNFMPWGLPLDEVTLAERFKHAGYNTHMVGKWNLGMFAEDYYPFNRGFDTFLGYLGPLETYYGHDEAYTKRGRSQTYSDFGYGDKDGYMDYTTNTTRQGPRFKGIYSTSLSGDRAITIASEHQVANEADSTDDPLFLYLAFQAAHGPMDVPEDWMFTEDQLKTLDSIEADNELRMDFVKIVYYLDITIRRIFDELDAMGMLDNTLVVLASDNGGCPSSGGSNYPYRGFKHTMFEGGVRAPALVYSKSGSIIPPEARGTVYDEMMHAVDWTPTLANVTGIPTVEIGKALSGFDQWSAIIGDRPGSSSPVRNEIVLARNSYGYDGDSSVMIKREPKGAYIYDGWKIDIGDKCTGWFSFSPRDITLADPRCDVGECPTCTDACKYEDAANNSFLFHLDSDPYEE
ncbi:unnamed protein product, partial [Laminaria digitata]